jgi:YidC/Oxa1 family membrane protein insertase
MEKRLLLSMVLCLLILLVYQSYVEKQNERWRAAHPEMERDGMQEAPVDPGLIEPQAPVVEQESLQGLAKEGEGLGEAPRDVPCEEVVVDTPLYRAVFCSVNGRPMRWALKKYQLHKPCECPVPGLKKTTLPEPSDGESPAWVERIHVQGPEEYPLALELSMGGDRRIPIRETLKPDRPYLELADGGQPASITFSGTDTRGRAIERVYTFAPDTYMVGLEVKIAGLQPALQQAGLAMRLTERIPEEARNRYTFSGFMAFINESIEKEKELDPGEPLYFNGNVHWQGFSDKYFLTSLLPVDNPVSSIKLEQVHPPDGQSPGLFISRLIYNLQSHLEGDAARVAYSLYIGPKDLDVLRETGHHLEKSIDLGWFEFIAKPLLVVLKFFYRYTHNYGIAIIILTILIKILFHPLTKKQMESMRAMQKLQPKMQALREKFKDDKERLNREVMDLYRTHKINPLGGCWPMLLQIPVFFALYKALLNSIELRHAPFLFWIQDLSEKDPCYITPIIMGATMFLQQKMTPMAGDPNQQKMMMFMPLIFTFMFLSFPSGLVLYWLVNNVLTIGQQFVSQRRQQ